MKLPGEDRRDDVPGRRATDEELQIIARQVRIEVRKLRWRWFVVWLITLILSVVAWRLADRANERTHRQADAAQVQADKARATARTACIRGKRFLPYFVQTLERSSDITPAELKKFRTLVPARC